MCIVFYMGDMAAPHTIVLDYSRLLLTEDDSTEDP